MANPTTSTSNSSTSASNNTSGTFSASTTAQVPNPDLTSNQVAKDTATASAVSPLRQYRRGLLSTSPEAHALRDNNSLVEMQSLRQKA
ncbi:hypothetical protein BGX33_001849, partial [Mortierella sp. NVP41]